MNSIERREARYKRRQELRLAKRQAQNASDSFDSVFSYAHLYSAYKKCRCGVSWKASVQRYISQAPLYVYRAHKSLQNGSFKSDGFYEFELFERGKQRHIRSVTMRERVVQRCLCDNALVPVVGRSFIYDNGATMKDKGYTFAVRRIVQHLREHYRHYGTDGYILLFDFSKFFDNVSHAVIKNIVRNGFTDQRIIALTEHFIDMFGDVGLGLGSQISQVLALSSANKLDHYIKEVCRIRGYGRYMDDGYLIHKDKEYLQKCLADIRRLCGELGIVLNEKKTQIIKLSHGFTFLKIRFNLTDTGRIVRRMARISVVRERRKLKKLALKVFGGLIDWMDVYQSFQSWMGYARNFNSYRARSNMRDLFRGLFLPLPA